MNTHAASARYGLLGAGLAFVALPLHVHLPAHYATHYGVPLAALGALLLAVRGLDAVLDPWFGRWADRLLGTPRLPAQLLTAGVVLALAFAALFQPAVSGTAALLAWAAVALVACYVAFSLLSITHQAWAARLGGGETAQTRLELLAVELQEEKLRLTGLALNTVLAGLLLGFGLVFLMVFLTVLFWDEHRLLALGISTAICLGGGLLAASNAARAFRSGTKLFSASLAELARDRAALKKPD